MNNCKSGFKNLFFVVVCALLLLSSFSFGDYAVAATALVFKNYKKIESYARQLSMGDAAVIESKQNVALVGYGGGDYASATVNNNNAPTDIEILKAHNVGIAHNPTSNLKLASGIANIPKYLQAGLNVGLGTDGCSSNNTLNMFKEMAICSFVQKVNAMNPTVLPAEEILNMATIGGAKVLRWDDEIGTLEVGKKADLILVDIDKPHFAPWNNPVSDLVYSAQGSDVKTTIVNGKILMKDYEVLTLDVERIMAETERIARNVL